jgi:hypothetical protein
VGLRASLDTAEEKDFLLLPGSKPRYFGRSMRSLSAIPIELSRLQFFGRQDITYLMECDASYSGKILPIFFRTLYNVMGCWDSPLGIATTYGLDDQVSVQERVKILFSSPQCQDWLWGSPSFLSNGYRG